MTGISRLRPFGSILLVVSIIVTNFVCVKGQLDKTLTPASELACWICSDFSTPVTCVKNFESWEFAFQSRPPLKDWPTFHFNIGGLLRSSHRIRRLVFEPDFSPSYVAFLQKFLAKQPRLKLTSLVISLTKLDLDSSQNATEFGHFVQGASFKAVNFILNSSRESLYYLEQVGHGGLVPALKIPVMDSLAILKIRKDLCSLNSMSGVTPPPVLFPTDFEFDYNFPNLRILKVRHQNCKISQSPTSREEVSPNLVEMWTTLSKTNIGPASSVYMVELDLDLDLTLEINHNRTVDAGEWAKTFPRCINLSYTNNKLTCGSAQ